MGLSPFKIEEFWQKYEFSAPYLLCPSDAESWSLQEILHFADPEARKLWDHLWLGYTESPGHPLLRKEIANLYSSIEAEQVITTAGAEEGIYCAMRSLLSPGDHVIVVVPCYQSLATIPQEIGAEVTAIKLSAGKGWKLDMRQLEEAFSPKTKLLVINYPHNPTGAVLEKSALKKMIELARARGVYILSDEVYYFLEVDGEKRIPSIADAYEKGITLNVMTKSFGLAGLRIGWLASRDAAFLKAAGSYKLYTSICNSAPSEILALIALRAKEKILSRNREIMLRNLQFLDQFFARYRSLFTWVRPQAGMTAFVELLAPIPVEEFAEKLVEQTGILIMPGSIFDVPGNFFRIGFGRKNMPEILELLEKYIIKQEII
ncbi:MAG TPA: aminotransferase class I/II-fold pyridoxal phosphate-dependent enzyme [Rhabdochlamydiaceae bacterium]|jgi:aspartate/methionine/tyrosine aminotransferase